MNHFYVINDNLVEQFKTHHYHQSINKWILLQIKNDKYLLNDKNIDINIQDLIQQVNDYTVPKVMKR